MSSASTLAIEAEGLVKKFGDTTVVKGVDLVVPAGVVYAVLGPNGAGKTTTVRMLATLLRPDGGSAKIFGSDLVREPDAVRDRISLISQASSLDEEITGFENLVLIARLLGYSRREAKKRAQDLLVACDLVKSSDQLVKHYSGGMRRRLDIAASIVVTPDLLFLDEPTTGLDPRSRNQVWDMVRALTDEGTTVLLTTQYLDEADQLSDRVAVIDNGGVIAEGTTGELKRSVGSGALQVRLLNAEQRTVAQEVLTRMLDVPVYPGSDPTTLSARVSDPERVAASLAELTKAGVATEQFALGQPSLDEVFLTLTGHRAGADESADVTHEEKTV